MVLLEENAMVRREPAVAGLFYPDDAHMPKVRHGKSLAMVKKVVFKVPVLP